MDTELIKYALDSFTLPHSSPHLRAVYACTKLCLKEERERKKQRDFFSKKKETEREREIMAQKEA